MQRRGHQLHFAVARDRYLTVFEVLDPDLGGRKGRKPVTAADSPGKRTHDEPRKVARLYTRREAGKQAAAVQSGARAHVDARDVILVVADEHKGRTRDDL